jgi:hypothetical protein
MRNRTVTVNDKMQQKGYRYVCSEPIGRNFDPQFIPDLTLPWAEGRRRKAGGTGVPASG